MVRSSSDEKEIYFVNAEDVKPKRLSGKIT